MDKVKVYFEVEERQYRVRDDGPYNLIIEEYRMIQKKDGDQEPGWVHDGHYYSPLALRRAILELVTSDVRGRLEDLFRIQDERLDAILKQITTQVESHNVTGPKIRRIDNASLE